MPHSTPPQIGLLLPTRGVVLKDAARPDVGPILTMARQAEAAGLDSVWVGDSLMAKPRLEPLATLAAVAMVTSRVRLGTSVLLAPLRHPLQLAQQAATVDLLSRGRLVLGLGVGGVFNAAQRAEWQAVGVEPKQRGARMDECVAVLRHLWAGEPVTFTGRHFPLEKVTQELHAYQPGGVPMLLACHHATGSEVQYRRAAKWGNGVMGITDPPEKYAEVLRRVRELGAEEGRDLTRMASAFYMTVNINPSGATAFGEADRFIRAYYGQNFWADKWGPFGPAPAVAQRILAYAAAGAKEVVVRFASIEGQAEQLQRFLAEVLPLVQAG